MKELELRKVCDLPFITKEQLRTVFFDADEKALDQNIFRWEKKGILIFLKRGLYVTKEFSDKNRSSIKYKEFIANILKKPSYISLDYVLRKHEILTDATFGMTSITLKPGSQIDNDFGTFTYRNIKSDLFTGYVTDYFMDSEVLIATKAKALFDYLYFKSPSLSEKIEGRNLVEDLRLNLETFTSDDITEVIKYSNLNILPKIRSIIQNIVDHAPNN